MLSSIVRFVRPETKKRQGPVNVSTPNKHNAKILRILGNMYLISHLYLFQVFQLYLLGDESWFFDSLQCNAYDRLKRRPPAHSRGLWYVATNDTNRQVWTKDNFPRFCMHDNMVVHK